MPALAAERRLLNRMIIDRAGDRAADARNDAGDTDLDERRLYRACAGGAPDRYKDVIEVAGHYEPLSELCGWAGGSNQTPQFGPKASGNMHVNALVALGDQVTL